MLFWCPEPVELVSVVDWDSTSLAWVFPAVVDSSVEIPWRWHLN